MKHQIELKATDIIWGTAATVARITAIDCRRLKELANAGVIRARKIGDSVQSPTLYRISDVCDWIEEQAPATFNI